jgi:hypothetical protein
VDDHVDSISTAQGNAANQWTKGQAESRNGAHESSHPRLDEKGQQLLGSLITSENLREFEIQGMIGWSRKVRISEFRNSTFNQVAVNECARFYVANAAI